MAKIDARGRKYLRDVFGSRVSFHQAELKLYGHDVATVPIFLKPLIGKTVPEAVVQPESEEELIELTCWAKENNIALTPRGKATSGYGGVLPLNKGVIVDFYRLNRIKSVDTGKQTVTVQAGIVWEKLDNELAKHGLTLRLYPTSYPAATVGGWLAQGGAGIGSYESGWFSNNAISARVVLPNGSVKEYTGDDLELVSEVEGITGFISEVTIRVMPKSDLEIIAITYRTIDKAQNFIQAVIDEGLPIWSLAFINPLMAELKNQAKEQMANHAPHSSKIDKSLLLPISYVLTLAIRKEDFESLFSRIKELIESTDGDFLTEEIAKEDWEERFNLMAIKILGPSLIPAEVVVPLSAMDKVFDKIKQKIQKPLAVEGIVIKNGRDGQPEVAILSFIPSDERKFSYSVVFALGLSIIKIAEQYDGRVYATGIYFAHKAKKVLGVERANRLLALKAKVDPQQILNPGKVIGKGMLTNLLVLAEAFERLTRFLGNTVLNKIGERPDKAVRGIPPDVAWYAYSCSQCGYCVDECDQFYGRGWESQSPRGKWYWLREYMEGREQWDQFMVDTILVCTTCELCNLRCSVGLPIEPSWMKLRGKLINEDKRMTIAPFEMMSAALAKEGDIWAGYRKDRFNWFPEDLLPKHSPDHKAKNVYFAGCTASYVEHDIGIASVRLLDAAGVDFSFLGEGENCCATPMLAAGKWDLFAETMKKNIDAVKKVGADTVICSCPACDMMWRQVYPEWTKKLGIEYGITAKHYSEVLAEQIEKGEFVFPDNKKKPERVTWHDSCHIGRASGVYEPPRQLIKAIPNVDFKEMSHNREAAHCCGSVLTLIKDPPVAADIGKTRLDEAIDVGAEKVLALCPCCEFQLRVAADKKKVPIEIVDLATYASSALGYEFPDPNPNVKEQWAVFEAMIALMTPQGFADLMSTMWPELIDAMPFGMGKLMRLIGKANGLINLMKPLFPVLFPRLLPMMMPKVMPVMLERVSERVPMPDYMRDQMPELMPKVMDNLMPHMIGDVVPLITQPLIDYLQKGDRK